jgi:cytosine/adenosine deaminase-related metal-dependent hydrolase
MQVTLNTQRMLAFQAEMRGEEAPAPIAVKDALAFATIGGAKANGIWDRAGSLTPGKRADLVLITAEELNNLPLNNAVATVVLGADTRNVDTVMIDGAPRKWGGSLVDVDHPRVRRMVTESRDRLLERIGRRLAVTGDSPAFMDLA